MRFEVFLAFRFLRARQYAFINLITILSMAGVALGVCALIVVLSVMSGFQDEFTKKIVGMNSHVTIYKAGGVIENPQAVVDKLGKMPQVTGVSPIVYGQVMLVAPAAASGAIVYGLEAPGSPKAKELTRALGGWRPGQNGFAPGGRLVGGGDGLGPGATPGAGRGLGGKRDQSLGRGHPGGPRPPRPNPSRWWASSSPACTSSTPPSFLWAWPRVSAFWAWGEGSPAWRLC